MLCAIFVPTTESVRKIYECSDRMFVPFFSCRHYYLTSFSLVSFFLPPPLLHLYLYLSLSYLPQSQALFMSQRSLWPRLKISKPKNPPNSVSSFVPMTDKASSEATPLTPTHTILTLPTTLQMSHGFTGFLCKISAELCAVGTYSCANGDSCVKD